jgi:hypothetical protein
VNTINAPLNNPVEQKYRRPGGKQIYKTRCAGRGGSETGGGYKIEKTTNEKRMGGGARPRNMNYKRQDKTLAEVKVCRSRRTSLRRDRLQPNGDGSDDDARISTMMSKS